MSCVLDWSNYFLDYKRLVIISIKLFCLTFFKYFISCLVSHTVYYGQFWVFDTPPPPNSLEVKFQKAEVRYSTTRHLHSLISPNFQFFVWWFNVIIFNWVLCIFTRQIDILLLPSNTITGTVCMSFV